MIQFILNLLRSRIKVEGNIFGQWFKLRGIWQDIRFSFRMLTKSPLVTVVALVSLAIGIGANSTVFSLANGLLFRPLDVAESSTLVSLFTSHQDDLYGPSSYPDFRDLRDRTKTFDGVAGHFYFPMGIKGPERAEVVMGQMVSWNFFDVVGVRPAIGRAFLAAEDQAPQGRSVAILSHRLWQKRFDGAPGVIGERVLVNSHPFEVVGVMPKGFRGLNVAIVPDVWVPITTVKQALPYPISLDDRNDSWVRTVARLAPGVSIARSQVELGLFAENLSKEHPSESGMVKGFTAIEAERNRLNLGGTTDDQKQMQGALMAIVALVLLIACFNVANLLLARAAGRTREIALRLALGASRWRVVRQLVTESLLLASVAGVLGILVAYWSIDLVLATIPPNPIFQIELALHPDARVFLFTFLASLLAGLLSGLAPAVRLFGDASFDALKEQGRSHTAGAGKTRMQSVLVTAQVAISLMLLVTAGLFLRSLENSRAVNPGFDTHNTLLAEVNLGYAQYAEEDGRQFYETLIQRVEALPGVESASLGLDAPLGSLHSRTHLEVPGYEPAPNERMVVRRNVVGPGYFETLGIELAAGRSITDEDRESTRPVTVINEALAQRYFKDRAPLGRTLTVHNRNWEIVGVARTGKYDSLDESPQPFLWIPLRQADYLRRFSLVARTSGAPEAQLQPVIAEIRRLDANLPDPRALTMEQNVAQSTEATAGPADIVGVLGALALGLALSGIYGLMAYSVGQRTQEFGIRMALGAERRQIHLLVLRKGLTIAVAGVVIGLVGALTLSKAITGLLYNVQPVDPVAFLVMPVALIVAALGACLLPARSAATAEPASALRHE